MWISMREPIVAFSCDDISPKTSPAKLKALLRIADEFDVNVTLFVIPKSHASWSSCISLAQVLKDCLTCGHEIGLHGLSHHPFETGSPFDTFSPKYAHIENKIRKGLNILEEVLETDIRGFRAPYHHYSKSLLRVLNDLGFLYDSSRISFRGMLLSYAPPLRTVWVSANPRLTFSRIFHPLNLRLWEIPVTQEYTWYNLKFEVASFNSFFKNTISKIETGCLVINSHIGALSTWGLQILKQLMVCIKETGPSALTLQEMAKRCTHSEPAKAYYV